MGFDSTIEWTNATWNPVTGCSKISDGCKNCYAERLAARLQAMGQPNYANGFRVTLHEGMLKLPLSWRRSRLVFVNSMSDLFHEQVPVSFIQRVFAIMQQAKHHTFQVLTKRADRLQSIASQLPWPSNVWMGVSVESEDCLGRIDRLRAVPSLVRFLSLEPLLGPLPSLRLDGIQWVIVGGESGPGARMMKPSWVRHIRAVCRRAKVRFFFKQWGGVHKAKAGRLLDGRTWDDLPPREDNAYSQRNLFEQV